MLLKTLECGQCRGRCYPYFGNPPVLVKECIYCAQLFCGYCIKSGVTRRCDKRTSSYYTSTCCLRDMATYYPTMAYFDKFAPADEINLLSLQRWSPLYCRACSSTKRVVRSVCLFCPYCNPTLCPPELFMDSSTETKIIAELNNLLADNGRRAAQEPVLCFRNDHQPDHVNKVIYFQCQVCKQCRNPVKHTDITDAGILNCMDCRGGSPSFNIGNIECLFYLNVFLQHVPGLSDLKELTYSKWTPLKCEKCSVAFSEVEERMPILDKKQRKVMCQKCTGDKLENGQNFIKFYFLVDVIKEFRKYFVNSGIDFEEKMPKKRFQASRNSTTAPENYHEEQLLVSSFITKPRTTVPETPRCQCGTYEDITKMKDCITCSVNAICLQCLVKDHWAHQITDTMPELIVEVVNHESAKIQRKLGNWRVRLEQTNSKGKEKFGNVVTAYEKLFLKALESKEPSELHNLISLGDFSELDDLLMETMTTNYRAFEKIDEFCAKLEGAPSSNMAEKLLPSSKGQPVGSTEPTDTGVVSSIAEETEPQGSTQRAKAPGDEPLMNTRNNGGEQNNHQKWQRRAKKLHK